MRTRRLLAGMITCAMAAVLAMMPSVAAAQDPHDGTFVDLNYPVAALAAGVAGTVAVRVAADASGRVTEAEALSGPAILRPAAVENARLWKLWRRGYAPLPRTEIIAYHFEIDHAECNDDSRSLFRRVFLNLAKVTACRGPLRNYSAIGRDNAPLDSYGIVPRYPQIARSARIIGAVVLDLSIAADGQVTEARVLSALPILQDVASAHARTWRVRTSSAYRSVVVYELTFDDALCMFGRDYVSSFYRVSSDHYRLSVCGWEPVNVSSANDKANDK